MDRKDKSYFNRSPVIGVDFDGTIVEHRWPEIGPEIPGAVHCLRRLEEWGARLVLWTNRSGPHLEAAVRYLEAQGVKLWAVNENPEQEAWTTSPKAYFHVLVDDASFGVPLVFPPDGRRPYVDWSRVGPELMRVVKSWKPTSIA